MTGARLQTALVVAVAFVALTTGSLIAAQNSVVGTWIGQTQVPDQGADQVTLTLTKTKSGFAGAVADSLGLIAAATEIKDLTFVNGELAGSFPLTDGAVVKLKMKLDGDKLKGQWEHESGDVGELVLERKKQ
jgi:hypothetical protein